MHIPAANARPQILLRSSWQTVNIGDIAHTPGLLTLLERHIPEADVWLWPGSIDNGVEPMLRRRFPNLRFVKTVAEQDEAIAHCDFFLHGSGPFLNASGQAKRWHETTGKGYGVYGITLPPDRVTPEVVSVLKGARFAYFRDSVSLAAARKLGVPEATSAFGPDAAFAVDLRDDARADAFLRDHDLEEGRFLCCIPRLRYTPFWLVSEHNRPYDAVKDARNQALKEQDHQPLREAICQIVRNSELKVLLCPEDATQMQVAKDLHWDRLPTDVRKRVVWRQDYWLTDEALSTYRRSAGLFGHEMHSPIMCIGNGIPALVVRWEEQTSKGIMWRDIGLDDWLFDFDQAADRERFPAAVLAWAQDLEAGRKRSTEALARVNRLFEASMRGLRGELGLPA